MKHDEPLILCVDDDPLYLKSLGRSLTGHGYRVRLCESASRALEALASDRPALALVDIMLPGMDGIELTGRLSHWEGGSIPVVLLTGLASEEAMYNGFSQGAHYLLEKSCERGKIFDVVDYFAGDLKDEERRALKERL